MSGIRLSICMATFRRGDFIGQTLDSILPQLQEGVEVVVVDGASPDGTPEVVAPYVARDPRIRYHREAENCGVDRDFDKAVQYAAGDYCWLMTDDDLLVEGAMVRVLRALESSPDLVVANAEVRDVALRRVLQERLIDQAEDREFGPGQWDELFETAAGYLSFIGGVVVRRDLWLSRRREPYYGSLFIHMGVLFQGPPLKRTLLLARPLISIRYGNAMWSARGFEIWMFKWPDLVWSFQSVSPEARRSITPREPWRSPRILFFWRAMGAYSLETWRTWLAPRTGGWGRPVPLALGLIPAPLANLAAVLFVAWRGKKPSSRLMIYDLLCSKASGLSRRLLRPLGLEEKDLPR